MKGRQDAKRLLVIQQVPHEGPGIIGPLAAREGFCVETVRAWLTGPAARVPRSAEGYSALLVLGGPMGVSDIDRFPFLADELRLIESALKRGVPTLGVCLGSQLIAAAAGARVYSGKAKEIGWYPVTLTDQGRSDRLFAGFADTFTVFQWHGDTFDVPPGAVNLAGSELFAHQVIRVGPRAYGVQFHLEVTGPMVLEWLRANSDELETVKEYIDPERIADETRAHLAGLHRRGKTFVRRFLRLAT